MGERLSVIVPMLNERLAIAKSLSALRAGAPGAELIVVDGGSTDGSLELVAGRCDKLLKAPAGRALQMNYGAREAKGDILAFVHADTLVPADFQEQIELALNDSAVVGGRFDVELDDPRMVYRLIATLINLRSRLTKVGTGDQSFFVRRSVFEALGGYKAIEICEDLDFARRLKRMGKIACLRSRVITSARRWQKHGVLRTTLLMWFIKMMFLLGVPPAFLKRFYTAVR